MKGTAYTPTEYLYASTRLRAREGKLVGRARLLQLAAMKDVGEVISALIGEGVLDYSAGSSICFISLNSSISRL